jgi:hypothetical protein
MRADMMKKSSNSTASALLAEQELCESPEKSFSFLNFEIHREGGRRTSVRTREVCVMSIDKKSEQPLGADRRRRHESDRGAADDAAWSGALSWWRCLPADAFDDARKARLEQCVGRISSTIEVWRKAIGGDAAAAVNIALFMRSPAAVTPRLDLAMTVLLRSALDNPGAAFVLSVLIRRMPLEDGHIATSWLVHNLLLAYPGLRRTGRLRRRRSIAFQLLNGGEGAS